MNHERYMARALQLASLGIYSTSPNPRVGCVIVKNDKIIGEGWHQKAGEAHAEVNALAQAGSSAKGATAYVTLEPCSHFGRTPPCAQALIAAGIKTVVGACSDPNPQVAGQGYQALIQAGIEVITPCLENTAQNLNAGFIKRMQTGLPRVQIKLAQSLDGRTAMASGESQWITGSAARQDVQRLRAQSCAIVTGADSVLIDNPSMTVRPKETGVMLEARLWRQPLRVIIDGQQRLTGKENIFQQAGDILLAVTNESLVTIQRSPSLGSFSVWQSPSSENGKVSLHALLIELGQRGCNNLLVETGAQLAGAFIKQGLVQELVVYCAPTLLGSSARPLVSIELEQMSEQIRGQWQDIRMVGDDLRLTLSLKANA